jgi:hypothetical protein
MINVKNTYEKLREVVVGDLDRNILELVNPDHYDKLSFIFDQTIEDLNELQKTFEAMGIKVYRPKTWDVTKTLATPYYEMQGHKVPLTPRDYFLTFGNTLIETTSWCKEASFSSFYYRDIFLEKFKQGSNWISMPLATHNPEYIQDIDDEVPNYEPLIDAPNLMIHDDIVFVSSTGSNNDLGLEWVKRHFPEYKYMLMDKKHFTGHLDAHFNVLAPGKILTWHSSDHFPDYFKNWDFIQIDQSVDIMKRAIQKLLDGRLQDDDFANTILSANSLSIDEQTIMMANDYKDIGSDMVREIERRGIEIIWIAHENSHFFNHGLTCITLDLIRDNG